MNRSQLCIHVARHAAARLAPDLSPDLPTRVGRVLAEVDTGDVEIGYDAPDAVDAASWLARCAVIGGRRLTDPARTATPDDLRVELDDALRADAPLPPDMSDDEYEHAIDVVLDEFATAAQRDDLQR